MIPFARILEYGNRYVPKGVKKLAASTGTMGLLYDDGSLFMRGNNSSLRPFGTDDPSDKLNWVKVLDGVDDVWCGTYHTIALLKNGEYWCAGYTRSLGLSGQNLFWQKYTKMYDLFDKTGLSGVNIRKIVTGLQGTHILFDNNNLYCIGFNNLNCLGIPSLGSQINDFTLTYSGAKDVCYNINATMVITTQDTLAVIGSSDNYKLGIGNATLSSWQYPVLPSPYKAVRKVYEGYRHSFLYADDGAGGEPCTLLSGYNGYNTLGQVPFTDTGVLQTYKIGNVNDKVLSFGTGYLSVGAQGLYTDGINVYGSGLGGYNIGSTKILNQGFKPIQVDGILGTVDSFAMQGDAGSNGATFVLSNNKIYSCGVAAYCGEDRTILKAERMPQ